MTQPLVSIITPCYNGEQFVSRYLDSVLQQTYSNIELIFVNDGSTDSTEKIALSYKERFEEKGIKLRYIYQRNKGLPGAINRGLEIFQGDYLAWMDSDDILHKDNIASKVVFLEENKEYGFVACKIKCVNEKDMDTAVAIMGRRPQKPDNLFLDLIEEHNVCLACGGYLVRASAFLDVNPNRHIYDNKPGQNWQMLLPLAYKYKCGYIQEALYYYVMRDNSLSQQNNDFQGLINKTYDHEDILTTVIDIMQIPENDYYQNIIKIKYIKKRLILAYQFGKKDILKEQYRLLKQNKATDKQSIIQYYCGICKPLDYLYRGIMVPLNSMRKMKRKLFK